MTGLIRAMQQEEINAQPRVRKLLEDIKNVSSVEFAEATDERLTYKKHSYGVEAYINQLRKVLRLLKAGTEQEKALEIVEACIDVDSYLRDSGKEQ